MHGRFIAKTGLVAAAFAAAAVPSFATMTEKDSSQFTYKYEMVTLPTAEDLDASSTKDFTGAGSWLTLGTGAKLGSASMVVTGSQALKADAGTVGNDGDVWRSMNATAGASGTGYTVEARLKVAESTGSIGALLLNASTGDSSINSWLVLRTDSLYWGNDTNRKIMDIDATAWHTYRIVREPGSLLHSLFVDGVLVADDLPNGLSANVNRIFIGAANTSYAGKAEMMWLRFDKGAYAPPVVNEKLTRKASVDFPDKYEMASDDDRLTASGGTDWKAGGSGATISLADGKLTVTHGGKNAYWDTQDAVWKSLVTATTPFTVEFRVKIDESTLADDRAFNFLTGTPGPVGDLFIGKNSVQWCLSTTDSGTFLTLDTSVNTDTLHTFRITYDGATRHGFTVWRDGEKIGENLVDCTNFYGYSGNALGIARFGKAGGLNDGAWTLDYVRWDLTGAYPWKNPPVAFTMVIR
ncbi:MAG: hypothetical protein IJ678_07925 [Kiritimatiellae bacterium]|nr:hypothetical protein [Kiritimatiellia bacterium]